MTNWFWGQTFFSIFLCLVVFVFKSQITIWIFGPDVDEYIIVALTVALALYCLPNLIEVWFRIKERPWSAFSYAMVTSALSVSTTYYFIVIENKGVWGFVYGQLLAYGVGTLIAGIILYKRLSFSKINRGSFRKMLHYGFPFVPAVALQLSVNWFCNFFTNHFLGLQEAGIFNMANTFAMILTLATNSFAQAYLPFAYSHYKREGDLSIYPRIMMLYCIIMCCILIGYSLFSGLALRLFTHPEFYVAENSIIVLSVHYFFISLVAFTNFGATLAKKTKYYPFFVGISVVITCILLWLCIPRFGIMGTAIALVIGQLSIPVLTGIYSNKVMPITYPYKNVAILIIITLICSFGIQFLPTLQNEGWNIILRLLVMILFTGLSTIILRFSGFRTLKPIFK